MKYDNEFQRRPWFVLIWMIFVGLIATGISLAVETLF